MNLIQRVRERKQLKDAYVATFSTPAGRLVLSHLLAESGITRPSFTLDGPQLLVDQGARRIVHSIFRMVKGNDNFEAELAEATQQEQDKI